MEQKVLIKKLDNFKFVESVNKVNYDIEIKQGDNGLDLRYMGEQRYIELLPGEIYALKTGLQIELPKGYCAYVTERSGLGMKYGCTLHARLIDTDYRGEIGVIMSCIKPVTFERGDRIAQIIIVNTLNAISIAEGFDLTETERGSNGFGSSGVK